MKTKTRKMTLGRVLLAGLFCGIITSLLLILYAFFYRDATGLEKYTALSPVVIFSCIPILTVISGAVYYVLVRYLARGEVFFITLFSVLILIGMGAVTDVQPSDGIPFITTAHGLLFGMLVIAGLAICLFLPYLAHHPKIYMTSNQIDWDRNYKP